MTSVYSFRTSDATGSASGILRTQSDIGETLNEIDAALKRLHPQWEASESDMYQEMMAKWQEGAEGLRSVLTEVREVLLKTRDGNSEVRSAVQQVLDQTH